jgi:hypothetical protein
MTSAQDRPRRRRRPRRPSDEPAGNAASASPVAGQSQGQPAGAEPNPAGRPPGNSGAGRREDSGRGRDSERGWRELAGSSPSQVGLGGALRARDVARPTAADLAAAERDVVVVRRQWQPPQT